MCFSATASFVVSAGLATAGVASLKRAKPGERFFAAIPLFFAVQQFLEGLQWLAEKPSTASMIFAYAYLFFAFLFWPVAIPWVCLKMEKIHWRKQVIKLLLALGTLVSTVMLIQLFTQPLTIDTLPAHISYNVGIEQLPYSVAFYILAVCGSMLSSSTKFTQAMGLLVLITALLSLTLWTSTFISIWCFMAAVISASIFFYFRFRKNSVR